MIQINNNDEHLIGVDGDADALGPGVFGVGLGAANANNGNLICSHKNWKMRKESRLNSVKLVNKKDTN